MKTPAFVFDSRKAKSYLTEMANADKGTTVADRQTRSYYRDKHHAMVWVDRLGVDQDADSLLTWLHQVGEIGMREQAFGVATIEQDLMTLRKLDFSEGKNDFTHVAARLEYQLTKACLRYCYGQRFGFINPNRVFNSLEPERTDSLNQVLKYRGLFDIKIDLPGKGYAELVLQKVRADSIAAYLREIQPSGQYYNQMKQMLASATTLEQRRRIIVNMERSRWRQKQPIDELSKHIVVNIPAYHLYAYNGAEGPLDMRVVCGNVKTKTPLLTSNLEWMEINPQWVIPMSIIENDVSRRAGDTAYFSRNRYHIYDRATGRKMSVSAVTRQMLLSGKYRVAQQGGAGNSLGRIVFRFKNNFSVFLHDTSNPDAFQRNSRAMSHGCVRVMNPFDLARFVLDSPDDWTLDRLRIAMGIPAESEQGMEYESQHPETEDRNKLISYVPIKPRVPIYILYYTLWPDENGVMQTWPDVYGYDDVVWNNLKPYL